MQNQLKRVKRVNGIVILTTFILFFIVLFIKGITHDILLEAGVFLVSAKLILTTLLYSDQNE